MTILPAVYVPRLFVRHVPAEAAQMEVGDSEPFYTEIIYRPFNTRHIFFHPAVVWRPRMDVMRHMVKGNLALITTRQTKDPFGVLATRRLAGHKSVAAYDINSVFPLYTYPVYREQRRLSSSSEGVPNLAPAFVKKTAVALSLSQEGAHGLPTGLTPEDIFHYAYAVFHSPIYRSRYADFLKIDFPRLPLTGSLDLFRALARLGEKLTALHLLESAKLLQGITKFVGGRNPEVEKVSWSEKTVWIDKAQSVGFRGVPEDVWNFHIGGYQVCDKWLKDRKGRTLTDEDIAHYQKIVVAISETIRLMKEIDEVIEQHGGWPGAFQTVTPSAAGATREQPRLRIVGNPSEEERYRTCVPLVPLKAAATNLDQDPQFVVDGEWEWAEVEPKHRLRPGMFVAQVEGRSMEPRISDGAFCLFASPVEGSRQAKTVLVKLHRATDPESGANYTIKRYESEKVADGDSWRHARITLKPDNPDFPPLVFTEAPEEEFAVVAEFLEVVTPPEISSEPETAFVPPTPAPPAPRRSARRLPNGQCSLLDSPAPTSAGHHEATEPPPPIDALDRDELICTIRQLFTSGSPRDRETAIHELKESLGYARLGSRIRETLDNALRTAVRRGVLNNDGDTLTLVTRSIDDYTRDFLKEQFLASLEGRAWKERDAAIRDFARWLGFRRTGANIDEMARSLINGLIREGRLDSDGSVIRRAVE